VLLRVLTLALVLIAAPPARAALAPAEQIAALNAQREANGIPGDVVEVPGWTEGCRRHMAYIAANGGVLTHEEDPSLPGYTPDGAQTGRRSVITPLEDAFNAQGNAFEFAPLHLMQVLAPALTRMGVWGGCATTSPGYDRRAARPALFTYPGDGATSVYAFEQASELPFAPGDFVGLPQGTTTGPHLLVMALGTGPGRITGAGLIGPSGPVAIRSVDNLTPGLEGYMPPGGMIIPVSPLESGSYKAVATFQPGTGPALSAAWTISTNEPPPATVGSSSPAYTGVTLRLDKPRAAGRSVRFRLLASPSLVGRRASITTYRTLRSCARGTCRERRQGRRLRSVIGRLAVRQTITAPRPGKGRSIKVEVQTQAFERAGVSYAAGLAAGRWSGA
jgi:hypothetical protein